MRTILTAMYRNNLTYLHTHIRHTYRADNCPIRKTNLARVKMETTLVSMKLFHGNVLFRAGASDTIFEMTIPASVVCVPELAAA